MAWDSGFGTYTSWRSVWFSHWCSTPLSPSAAQHRLQASSHHQLPGKNLPSRTGNRPNKVPEAQSTQDAGRDALANSNVFPLMLLACSVENPIHINRSHLLASRVLCGLGPRVFVELVAGANWAIFLFPLFLLNIYIADKRAHRSFQSAIGAQVGPHRKPNFKRNGLKRRIESSLEGEEKAVRLFSFFSPLFGFFVSNSLECTPGQKSFARERDKTISLHILQGKWQGIIPT